MNYQPLKKKRLISAILSTAVAIALLSLTAKAGAQTVGSLSDTDSADNEVAENSPVGAAVGITAQAANATTYTLSDSADGLFAINSSGTVTVAIDMLDHEASSSHTITVQARNPTGGQSMSFTIQVTDVDEPAGHITDINLSPDRIAFGSTRGDTVGITARAVDPDQDNTISYSLSEDSTGLFIIGQQNGVVTLASGDYDSRQSYPIVVQAMSDDDTFSTSQFTIRPDESIRIALTPATPTVVEGKSRDIAFSVKPILELKSINAGDYHTCGITPDNRAVCWGDNANRRSSPPSGRFIAVSAGFFHSCGITPDNSAVCWGLDSSRSTMPSTSQKFIAIGAGGFHSCGITAANAAVCWGDNSNGQAMPVPDKKLIALSAGFNHNCAVTADNEAVCWGANNAGQGAPPSGRKFISVSAGSQHSCGITLDNKAVCWGDNSGGQAMPVPDDRFLAISAGDAHSCGVTLDNKAVCWGDNSGGQAMPIPDDRFLAVSAGDAHSCGITIDNAAVCWGSDSDNQRTPPQIAPIIASSITITLTVADADKQAITISDNGRAVISSGEARSTLTFTVADNSVSNPMTDYTIGLAIEGHAAFDADHIIITVIDSGVITDLRDTDGDAGGMVAENSPIGAEVGITAQADNATTYTLSDSADGLFAIGPQSGLVTVAMDMLDYEAFSSHGITVQARNPTGSQAMSFIIQVTDVLEAVRPIFDIDLSPNEIAFGSSRGDAAGITARAIDPDRGSVVSYRLSENPGGLFAIGRQNGVVTLASNNYDPDRDYLIEVTAESNDNTSSAAQFTVKADEPIRMAPSPAAFTLREGESQDITLSFTKTEPELIAISAGNVHTCGITPGNDAVCWGDNSSQQTMPVPDEKLIAISAGQTHTCAITADNDAVCWGKNSEGQSIPPSNRKFIAIAAGTKHTCGITTDNEAVCWGNNRYSQTASPSDRRFTAINAGDVHTCGITPGNEAVCWGLDSFKQSSSPSNRKFIAINSGNRHSCGITPDNDAVCWGSNASGRATPPAGRKFIAVSAGQTHTCGITPDNKAVCWGARARENTPPQIAPTVDDPVAVIAAISDADRGQITLSDNGQLVIPAGEAQITLTVTVNDDGIREDTADYTVALSAAGFIAFERDEITVTVPADGRDLVEDIDDREDKVAEDAPAGAEVGITVRSPNAARYALSDSAGGLFAIDPQSGTVTVAMSELDYEAFSFHTIVVEITTRGARDSTLSLNIQVTDVPEPVSHIADIDFNPNEIAFGSMSGDAVGITARAIDPDRGGAVSYRLSENPGGLFAIGRRDGVVTLASDGYNPRQNYLIEVTAESNDGTSSAAQFTVRADELIRIAPSPTTFNLREGASQAVIFSFAGAESQFKGISAGRSHSCAITPDDRAVCWGNPADNRSAPSLDRFSAVSAGRSHSCAITPDNDAVCWGADSAGQSAPPASGKFIAVSAGGFHSCGITPDNDAVCWGSNSEGQRAPPANGKFIAVSAGEEHNCAITPANDAVCWGSNSAGQRASPSGRKFTALSAGRRHSCGITLANDAVCWGTGPGGATMPPAGGKFIAVSAGEEHTCGITVDNAAVCWGNNGSGQTMPIPDERFIAVSAGGSHSCGIASDNKVVCWGNDDEGQRTLPEISPIANGPTTVTAALSDADRRQLTLSDEGRAVILAREAQTTLIITAVDDDAKEDTTSYTIALSAAGSAELERNEITITIPVDGRDIVEDGDEGENTVAENASVGAKVGITVQAPGAARYTLTDDAGGLFAIDRQSGVVTVAMNQLDYEAFMSHAISARVNAANRTLTIHLNIRVTDVPEPIKPIADIDFSPNRINHGSSRGDAVGITARAIDPDRGSAVSYRLSRNPSGIFAVGRQDGVVTLASDNYRPDRDYSIEVTARSNDNTSSAAQFTVRRDEPIRIASQPAAATIREGESQAITFSFTETELELIAIGTGIYHSCGITPDNRAVCWGGNRTVDGNRLIGQSMPPSGRKFIAISAGDSHNCGITPASDAVCWGLNDSGQSMPPSGRKFIAIAAGSGHSCGITPANDAVCWGDNTIGQSMPPSGRKFIAVSAGGSHTCAITPGNEMVCWGLNESGQRIPPASRKFIAIAARANHNCGITADNDAVCWGRDNAGQSSPPAGRKLIAISAGGAHSCGITPANEAVCWGSNSDGRSSPPAGKKFIAIAAGDTHTCGITLDNDAACWGHNNDIFGQFVGQSSPPQTILAAAADPTTIAAMISDTDKGQISHQANGQAAIPAGETQATLTVTAGDDDIIEPDTRYTISLSATGNTALEPDKLIITVPADNNDTQVIGDIDSTTGTVANVDVDGAVAENSPAGAEVGIIAYAANTTRYSLIDNAGGRFAINNNGLVTVADGSLLNYENATSHSIVAQAGNANRSTIRLTIQVTNVNEITLEDTDGDNNNNIVIASTARAVVEDLTLKAAHADGAAIIGWAITAQTSIPVGADLLEFNEPADSSDTRTLRIKSDANLASITTRIAVRLSVRVNTADDEASEDFDVEIRPETSTEGIRLRVRVYLEGALE